MTSELKMLGPVEVELSVQVPREDVDAAVNKAYGKLRRTARVRGFRQGKVPRSILQGIYGKAIRAEVQNELVQVHLLKALQDHDVSPLSSFKFGNDEFQENSDFNFSVSFEVRPRLEKINYEGIELKRYRQTVTPEDVDAELERLRSELAAVSDLPEPRPAQSGDVAMVSMKRWVDGNWEESGLPDQELIIGEDQAPKALEGALVGMSVGEEKVVDLGSSTALEENRLRYLVRLSALKERRLPDLDDEFAKDTGNCDTIADLRHQIENQILKLRNRREDQRVRMTLFDALREKNAMDLPPSLLSQQAEGIKKQYFARIASQLSSDDEKGQKALSKLDDSAQKTAASIVHQHLLMMEIARLEGIQVSDEEIDAEIERHAAERGIPAPMIRAELGKEGRREEFASHLLEKKIFDFVQSRVTITELDGPDKDDEQPAKPPEEPAAISAEEPSGNGDSRAKAADAKRSVDEKAPVEQVDVEKTTVPEAEKKLAKKAAAKKTPAQKAVAKETPAKKTTAKKAPAKKDA